LKALSFSAFRQRNA